MKTIIAIIAICLAALLLLAGCAQQNNGGAAQQQAQTAQNVPPAKTTATSLTGTLPPDITDDAGLSGAYAEIDDAQSIG